MPKGSGYGRSPINMLSILTAYSQGCSDMHPQFQFQQGYYSAGASLTVPTSAHMLKTQNLESTKQKIP